MSNFFYQRALTGGSSIALDSINGNKLTVGDFCIVNVIDTTAPLSSLSYMFAVSTSTAAESSPDVIVPDANRGTSSNSIAWIRIPYYTT